MSRRRKTEIGIWQERDIQKSSAHVIRNFRGNNRALLQERKEVVTDDMESGAPFVLNVKQSPIQSRSVLSFVKLSPSMW